MNFIGNMLGGFGNFLSNKFGRGGAFNAYLLGQEGAVWLDVSKPSKLYYSIPQARIVIDKLVSMYSNMRIQQMDRRTLKPVEKEDADLKRVIDNPNPLQSMNEWLSEWEKQVQVYGNSFGYFNKPSKIQSAPTTIWNISPRYMQPVLSGKVFDQIKIEDIITGFKYIQANGKYNIYDPKDILYTKLVGIDNPLIGESPIRALQYPLSNIRAAYQFLNTLSVNRGPKGILSNDAKDVNGAIPMTDSERKDADAAYNQTYGIEHGQAQSIVTTASLKWQAMSFPTKDALLIEQIDANFLTICDAYGMNANLFSNKNATFENIKQGLLQSYQDTIFPIADARIQALSNKINHPTIYLVPDYSHLDILKENKLKGISAVQALVSALTQAVQGGILPAPLAVRILENELLLQTTLEE